jgi:transcriptional regulator with XRE-family HTH domain
LQRGWVVSSDYRALIDALVRQRQELSVSQRELARRLGKPPSFINKIELLERRLDLLEFIAIAEALEQKADVLLQGIRASLPDKVSI